MSKQTAVAIRRAFDDDFLSLPHQEPAYGAPVKTRFVYSHKQRVIWIAVRAPHLA
jgi:hypothetical protein